MRREPAELLGELGARPREQRFILLHAAFVVEWQQDLDEMPVITHGRRL